MRFRLGRLRDLEECRALLHPGFKASARVRRALLDIWADLIVRPECTFHVVEDPADRTRPQVRAFALGVFVAPDFAKAYIARPYPYLTAAVYESFLDGRSPILDLDAIREANSGAGLYSVALHFEFRDRAFDSAQARAAFACGVASGHFGRGGYRMNAALGEVYGAPLASLLTEGGYRMIEFGPDEFDAAKPPPADNRPIAIMATLNDVPETPVHGLADGFYSSPPRFFFTTGEQRVLELALLDYTDSGIARELNVSADAVKKTWGRIFARVATAAPRLLADDVTKSRRRTRGSEKRRRLLRYLRLHMEELRPFARKSARTEAVREI